MQLRTINFKSITKALSLCCFLYVGTIGAQEIIQDEVVKEKVSNGNITKDAFENHILQ